MLRKLVYIFAYFHLATSFKISVNPRQYGNNLLDAVVSWNALKTNIPKALTSTVLSSFILHASLLSSPCYADNVKDLSTQNTPTLSSTSMTFNTFLNSLDEGKVGRVLFHGINPTYLTAYYKTGEVFDVKDGFPSYNDPLSQSGPSQAISRVQHTPGVICQQDISDVLMKSTTRKSKELPEPKTMLQHSAYPRELGYNANK